MKYQFLSLLPLLLIIAFSVILVAGENFEQCLRDFNKAGNSTGGMDNKGNPVQTNATSLTYQVCRDFCGPGQEPFSWSVFSKQFSAWLLPWLALASQLPFGAKLRKDNVMALLLTVGSPTLAAYSLILTVLNGHYVARRFYHFTYPNAYFAVRILAGLQQSALRIVTEDGLLASLVVLPQNDKWWAEMTRLIDYEHTWSISALANISWVIIAYVFTVANSFADIPNAINSNGQGVGSLWLWLLPIVVGWLLISPKCDADRLDAALSEANGIACLATINPDVVIRASSSESNIGARRAFMFDKYNVLTPSFDEGCTSPIFNYSRFLPWMTSVERVAGAFENASRCAEDRVPVTKETKWKPAEDELREKVHVDNRRGSIEQVIEYCAPGVSWQSRWHPNIVGRMFTASVLALALQWVTAGSAIVVVWFTPTTGLGCRSGSYLLYAIASTVIWLMMLTSSVLVHYAVEHKTLRYHHKMATTSQRIACVLAIVIICVAKVLAAANSLWIIVICIFQFTNVFNNCYCNGSVLGRGETKAYSVITLLPQDETIILRSWVGGVAMSLGAVFLFIGYVRIFLNTPGPQP